MKTKKTKTKKFVLEKAFLRLEKKICDRLDHIEESLKLAAPRSILDEAFEKTVQDLQSGKLDEQMQLVASQVGEK